MEKSLYLAGVGGQGLQVAGKAVVEAAMGLGYNVTYSPSTAPPSEAASPPATL